MKQKSFFLTRFFVIVFLVCFLFIINFVSAQTCETVGFVDYETNQYCDVDGQLKDLKPDGSSCLNDFECLRMSCNEGLCQSEYAPIIKRETSLQQLFDFILGYECIPGEDDCAEDSMLIATCGSEGVWEEKNAYVDERCGYEEPTPPTPIVTECTLGEEKCEGTIYFLCGAEETWENKGEVEGKCGYVAPKQPECSSDESKCEGEIYYICGDDGNWENQGRVDGSCGYVAPECTLGEEKCEDAIYFICDETGQWQNQGVVKGKCLVECLNEETKCEGENNWEYFICSDVYFWETQGKVVGQCSYTAESCSLAEETKCDGEIYYVCNETLLWENQGKVDGECGYSADTGGGGGGSSRCTPAWICTGWSNEELECGTRTCRDQHNCRGTFSKPIQYKRCSGESFCGDGVCDFDETSGTCPSDCQTPPPLTSDSYCGDGVCDDDESSYLCSEDCEPNKRSPMALIFLGSVIVLLILGAGGVIYYKLKKTRNTSALSETSITKS